MASEIALDQLIAITPGVCGGQPRIANRRITVQDIAIWDENVPTAVTHGLRLRGVDVLTTQEAGMLVASDDAQLALAISQERVLFSQDPTSWLYIKKAWTMPA